jgi:hypothetical protein
MYINQTAILYTNDDSVITIVFLQLSLECQTCQQAKSHPDNQAAQVDPVDLVDQVLLFTNKI